MTELQFDPMQEEPPQQDRPEADRPGPDRGLLGAAAATAVVLLLGIWWFLRPNPPAVPAAGARPPAATTSAPPPAALGSPAAAPDLPPLPELEQSDAFVRALAAELFGSPALDGWLASSEELIHRGVRALLAISQQRSARRFLDLLPLDGPFAVQSRGGEMVIAPESYRRYDRFVDLFEAVDVGRLVGMFERIGPLLSRSMDENAFPGTEFESILRTAIDHLLATPVPQGELAVVAGEDGLYRFADPAYEALSPPQKQFLRLGPGNGGRVRAKLEAIESALGPGNGSGGGGGDDGAGGASGPN